MNSAPGDADERANNREAINHDARRIRPPSNLLLPGDFFGLTVGDEYDFNVEAAVDGTIIAGYPRRAVEKIVDSDPRLMREINFETGDKGMGACYRDFAASLRDCCDFREIGISPSERSPVGHAYALCRLNKARKLNSVPFKSYLLWRYGDPKVPRVAPRAIRFSAASSTRCQSTKKNN